MKCSLSVEANPWVVADGSVSPFPVASAPRTPIGHVPWIATLIPHRRRSCIRTGHHRPILDRPRSVELRCLAYHRPPLDRPVDELLLELGVERVLLDTGALQAGDPRHPGVAGARHDKPRLPAPSRVTRENGFLRWVGHPLAEVNEPPLRRRNGRRPRTRPRRASSASSGKPLQRSGGSLPSVSRAAAKARSYAVSRAAWAPRQPAITRSVQSR